MVPRGSVVVAAALATVALAAGCGGSDDPSEQPSARATTLAQLDIAGVQVARAEFCDQVPEAAVLDALGSEPAEQDDWGNGDPVPGSDDRGDLGHELGCSWTTGDGTAARAWVFGRPVDADFAATLVRQAGERKRCTTATPRDFGSPSVLQTCALTGGVERVRRAGLLGDSWLTCEVAGPQAADPPSRLDAWCVAVLGALDLDAG
jgi:hypothetical protein